MTTGSKIIEGAKDAAAIVRGEIPAARITINGHVYVPEASSPAIDKAIEALQTIVANLTRPNPASAGEIVKYAVERLNALRGQEDGS